MIYREAIDIIDSTHEYYELAMASIFYNIRLKIFYRRIKHKWIYNRSFYILGH